MKSLGFIGGGRITKIILSALEKGQKLPAKIYVSDVNADVLETLKKRFPTIEIYVNDNNKPLSADYIFVSLHPPVMPDFLATAKDIINRNSILISLAPKLKIAKITELLGGFDKIVRMNPNAPTIIGKGYCPVIYSNSITNDEKAELANLFVDFGEFPEIEEEKLESYAIITAMGPTYFNFQIYELIKLAQNFGLSEIEAKNGVKSMLAGAIETIFDGSINPDEVMNLVPVKPLQDAETKIIDVYEEKLNELFKKLKS